VYESLLQCIVGKLPGSFGCFDGIPLIACGFCDDLLKEFETQCGMPSGECGV
jgi:hypothetical protein